MGFLYISLVVIGITTVAYLSRMSAKRGVSSFDFTFVMFAVASVLGYFFARWNHVAATGYTDELWFYAILAGVGGSAAVFVFNNAVRVGHFGYSNAIYRSSFLIPVVFSVAVFGAVLNATTVAGILLILASIFLVSWSNDAFAKSGGHRNLLWFLMIVSAFALSGLPRVAQLLTSHSRLDSFAYLFASYVSGFLLLLVIFLIRRKGVSRYALIYGSVAAAASFVGVYCTLEALKLLRASIVFPVTLSAPILLGMFISFLCRERIRPAGWVGVFLGIFGILMLSLQAYTK